MARRTVFAAIRLTAATLGALAAAACASASSPAATGASPAAGQPVAASARPVTAAPDPPARPRVARTAAEALALAVPVLFHGNADLVVRNTHSLSYVATTAGLASEAVGARWIGPGPASEAAWLVVGTAVVGPACRCDPPRPETVWAIVPSGRSVVDAGAAAATPGLRAGLQRLGKWQLVPMSLTARFA